MLKLRRKPDYPPWLDSLEMMRRNMDRTVDQWPEMMSSNSFTAEYPMDMHEEDGKLVVDFEVPGFKKDEVDITIDNGVLTMAAERKADEEPKGRSHMHERRYTRVERTVALPCVVHEEKAYAQLHDGVLRLEVPINVEKARRQVPVK